MRAGEPFHTVCMSNVMSRYVRVCVCAVQCSAVQCCELRVGVGAGVGVGPPSTCYNIKIMILDLIAEML